MRRLFISSLAMLMLALTAGSAVAQTSKQDEVVGVWFNQEKDAKLQIYKEGSKYMGKIVWLKDPYEPGTTKPAIDDKNPDPALRNRPSLGLVIMKNFVYEEGKWVGGNIYDPKSGKTYNCKMTLKNYYMLNVRGYIGYSWMGLGRTDEWTRTK